MVVACNAAYLQLQVVLSCSALSRHSHHPLCHSRYRVWVACSEPCAETFPSLKCPVCASSAAKKPVLRQRIHPRYTTFLVGSLMREILDVEQITTGGGCSVVLASKSASTKGGTSEHDGKPPPVARARGSFTVSIATPCDPKLLRLRLLQVRHPKQSATVRIFVICKSKSADSTAASAY